MNPLKHLIIAFILGMLFHDAHAAADAREAPNFVLINCDNLGYGDVGCFGSKKHRTPHIDRMAAMESLFLGAHVTVCRQLGLPPSRPYTAHRAQQLDQDAAAFTTFSQQLSTDPDLGRDARMMVPVFFDIERRKTKVWVFVGWSSRPVQIGFAKRPAVTVLDANQKPVPEDKGPILIFETSYKSMAYPAMAEVYVTRILNREEFRQHCDKYKTRKQILENLE